MLSNKKSTIIKTPEYSAVLCGGSGEVSKHDKLILDDFAKLLAEKQNRKTEMNKILQFFKYEHLTNETLKAASKPVCDLAVSMDDLLPDGPEKSAGLRKLLEAKDCFVRAALYKD